MASRTKRALLALLAGVLAVAGLTLVVVGSASAANLVVNPGFDGGAGGWTCTGGATTVTRSEGDHLGRR